MSWSKNKAGAVVPGLLSAPSLHKITILASHQEAIMLPDLLVVRLSFGVSFK